MYRIKKLKNSQVPKGYSAIETERERERERL
jgi:hypothetical protein